MPRIYKRLVRPRTDHLGEKHNSLLIIRAVRVDVGGESRFRWVCRCDCGKEVVNNYGDLLNGRAKSCGCTRKITMAKQPWNVTHGYCKTPTYRSWRSMRERCNKPNDPAYKWYGGRGITVCDQWQDSFENFLADMGERPAGMTLDRIDNNGNYEPGNCRWATMKQQQRNRRSNRHVTVRGQKRIIAEWAEISGIAHHTIRRRLIAGWPDEAAVSTPPNTRKESA